MRKTVLSFLEDHADRGTAFAHWRGLRVSVWPGTMVFQTARRFARELEARKISKGDRVLFVAGNSPQWVAAFFGCLMRGVIVVPLDVTSAPDFLERVFQQTDAKLLLHDEGERPPVMETLPGINLQELARVVAAHPATPCAPEAIGEDDIVEIIYTSGTTTEPKGVILTHANLLANLSPLEKEVRKYLKWERLVHPLRFLNLLPLSHIFGQFMGIFVPQLLGGEVFFQDSLNPSEVVNTARKRRTNVIVTVPRLLETLREKMERECERDGRRGEAFRSKLEAAAGWHFLRRWWAFRDLRRQFGWRLWAFISGGATLSPETESFWQRLGYAVVQGYGMTETASLVSVNHPFKLSRGSIGKTLPGQEVKLDESGEIMVRGRNISPGYWNGDAPLSHRGSEEGWLRTGDMGELDAAGNLFFKGRLKDVIVTAAGLNIYPEDLEAALKAQPEVRDCAVVPLETARGPEPIAALIMREEGAELAAAAAAVERANRRLAEAQKLRHWLLWPEPDFPRTATQKVMRRKVAELLKARLSGQLPALPSGTSALAETIGRVTGRERAPLDPSATLATDLKLDSLGRVELLSALEDRYQVEIDEAAFTAATTLGEIERMIHEGSNDQAATPYPYPEWAASAPVILIRLVAFYLFLQPLTRLMCWVKVRGTEQLKGLDGPVLFISNHITMADHALILSALPGRFRRHLAIAMEGEILRDLAHPPVDAGRLRRMIGRSQYALLVTLFNVFPLPKKSGFRRSFAYAGEAMDRGQSVLVFPEGKRSEDGHMNPFMTGIGVLATGLYAPVVPVRIEGLFKLKQQKKYFARPREVTILFGEPVRLNGKEDSAWIANELEKQVATLKE
ncbi:MAG TPA: AMP-binding protein [Pyrinomonadaceae bacterium]|jgi:long-chain acyl-CoA synthetase